MMPPATIRSVAPIVLAAALVLAAAPARAQEPREPPPAAPAPAGPPSAPTAETGAGGKLPGGVEAEAERITQPTPEDYLLEGSVTIRSGRSRIQADRILLRGGRFIEAEGNVLIVWENNRIGGSRMRYDLTENRGVVEDAAGQVEADADVFFVGKTAEKVGDDLVILRSATISTCTQPTPYWSFRVTKARARINHYLHVSNLVARIRRVPVLYLPYLIWPIKRDRAAGLLIPEPGSTRNRGDTLSQAFFFPMGASADLTAKVTWFEKAGIGWGGELNFVPNDRGSASVNGFFINDKVAGEEAYQRYLDDQAGIPTTGTMQPNDDPIPRWWLAYRQTQQFLNGFRMVADVNQVSDFRYFSDYERDLGLVSSPSILARIEFSRNGSWTSVNVREMRREQLLSEDTSSIQEALPEIEWRGRSRRLGKTPFYLTYESSLASLRLSQDVGGALAYKAEYLRGDLFPTLSIPFSPAPWLDVTPTVSYRLTHYTQSCAPPAGGATATQGTCSPSTQKILDKGLTRGFPAAGLELVGPKFFRIFERPKSAFSPRYKHTVEPFVTYGYQQAYDRPWEILSYDEVDQNRGASNQMGYGVRSRLFAQRPRAKPTQPSTAGERVLLPDGDSGAVKEALPQSDPAAETAAAAAPAEPVEIASIEIRQYRSFDTDLNQIDRDDDDVPDEKSRSSRVSVTGRFNPSQGTSLDLRANYDPLWAKISDVSLSGNLLGRGSRVGFSLVRKEGLGVTRKQDPEFPEDPTRFVLVPNPSSTQVRLTGGLAPLYGKIRVDFDWSYDVAERRVRDQRWRVEYYTQCCAFGFDYLRRSFELSQRGDFRVTVDLLGIGRLLRHSF